uniref:Odorant receptor n=1 Tax=Leucinodes orbonalis TaxID=711050 RepID=A0AAU0QLF6_9NEOP|nr:odorant receptor [Leucinodes orbonalis]
MIGLYISVRYIYVSVRSESLRTTVDLLRFNHDNDFCFIYLRLCWNFVYWSIFVHIALIVILDFMTIRKVILKGDVDEAPMVFEILPCIGYLSLSLFKTYKMVTRRCVFENLIHELRSMWPDGEVAEDESSIVNKALKEVNIFIKVYYFCNNLLALSVMIPPYFSVLKRIIGYDVPRILPYSYWIPYDGTQPVWYEFTITLMAWQTFATLWCMLAGDLLFCVLLSHITTQFDLLCLRIRRLFYVTVDEQLIEDYPLGMIM